MSFLMATAVMGLPTSWGRPQLQLSSCAGEVILHQLKYSMIVHNFSLRCMGSDAFH